jgi:hypothetical protein
MSCDGFKMLMAENMSATYRLTKSIIHKCPALVLPDEFLRKIANMVQIVPMHCTQEVAEELCNKLNSTPQSQRELTDEQILKLWSDEMPSGYWSNADICKSIRAINAAIQGVAK